MSNTKRFKEYIEEQDVVKQKRLKKESRHNFKTHLRDLVENEKSWDDYEDELQEQGRIRRR